ncbi:MAG: prepilin-type N-terminal cleavage/methylation domain-containing protein [Verrucomicrobia bacterium]|nr:prepilin-type N-terminal cleavage/methylation domain-containing protein [Verrucomicrobiota bacterium]
MTLKKDKAFTILEVILAMAVLALLSGAIYAISMAAMQATRETLEEELTIRRLEGFLRITRDAFLNLPSNGSVYLDTASGSGIPDLYFEKGSSLFGIPSLGGGTLVLAARPRPNGTRTFSVLRIPQNVQGSDRDQLYEKGNWISLLPNVIKPHWSFFRNGEWLDEWPQGAGRPQLVRLEMNLRALPHPIVATFYLPPTSGMGAVPSLDDLLNQLRMLKDKMNQQQNSNQPIK